MSTPTLLQRLKERKLVQWAVAYLAGAFVVFQLLDALSGPLGLTTAIQRGVLVVVAIGLFITLVLAWYHGEKGRQRVSGPELLMLAALLVVAGVALSLLGGREGLPKQTGNTGSLPLDDDRPSVAVLLCDNFSPNAEDAFRAQGIHEEILLRLQGISSLRSIGRTSVLQFADDPPEVSEIATALRVEFVGECSVLKDPNQSQIRVTFQLLDASGTHVWADSYDRDLTVGNLLNIQSDIAQQVASAVGAILTSEEEAQLATTPTQSLQAYEHYLRGRRFWNQRTAEAFDSAELYFSRAILLDPDYAQAYAALAETYAILPEFSDATITEVHPLAKAAAEKALSLDPDLAGALSASGYVAAMFEWDWDVAETAYLRAIQINPDYATAHQWYAELLTVNRRWSEAQAAAQKAFELDPLSFPPTLVLGVVMMCSGQLDEAIRVGEKAVRMERNFTALRWLALAYVEKGDYLGAKILFDDMADLSGTDPQPYHDFLTALTDRTRATAAVEGLKLLTNSERAPHGARGQLAQLGAFDETLTVLEQDFKIHQPMLPWVNALPQYDGMRTDRRFQDLLRRMNLHPR